MVTSTKSAIRVIELDSIKPNPWQPERLEDTQGLQELAYSILAHGMIETPVARESLDGKVELATGHRRLAAHRLLLEQGHREFFRIRVRIAELSHSQMADIVLQENKKRQDLDPISEAKFYHRYLEAFKVTQTELARRVGVSQGEIANTLRLLELPDQAQAMIISREITPRHGRELLRVARWPKLQEQAMKALEKEGLPVEALATELDRTLRSSSLPLSPDDYPKPIFDLSECEKCSDRVMISRRPSCVNKKCWEKKQSEAVAAREKKFLEKLGAKGAGARHERLDYGTYERLTYNLHQLDNPQECEGCEHRHFLKDHNEDYGPVCVDLKCFRLKKAKKTREDNERARQEHLKVSQRIEAALADADPAGRDCSLLTLETLLRCGWVEATRWFYMAYGLQEKPAEIADRLPALLKGKSDEDLRRMVPRLALEALRSQRPDRLNHYLRRIEGGPTEIVLQLKDGTTQKKTVEDIYLVKEPFRKPEGQPVHYFAYYITQGMTGCLPVTEESFKELVALGVKREMDYGG